MRTLYFLLPGTGGRFACGGLWAELKTVELARQICDVEVVTYRQREKETRFLDDVLTERSLPNAIFMVSWGFDVAGLAKRLRNYNVVYHAHSTGYGFRLPSRVPIITVSRNSMGYWGQRSPHSLIYYLPNQISNEFYNRGLQRDIDVLVQARKSSRYLLNELVPALQQWCQVCVVNSYVEDLAGLFNRAKVYLYDSAEYWALQNVSEGFGLQPLEAIACGCHVFSSVNGGLADYLDPGFNCYKIAGYSVEYDVQRILRIAQLETPFEVKPGFLDENREDSIRQRLRVILAEINHFFDEQPKYTPRIQELTPIALKQLKLKQLLEKIRKKMKR